MAKKNSHEIVSGIANRVEPQGNATGFDLGFTLSGVPSWVGLVLQSNASQGLGFSILAELSSA